MISALHADFEILHENENILSVKYKIPDYSINENGIVVFKGNENPDVDIQQMSGFYAYVPKGKNYTLSYKIISQTKTTISLLQDKESPVFVSKDGYSRNHRIILVNVNPLSIEEDAVFLNSEIDIEITFTQSEYTAEYSENLESGNFDQFVNSLVINCNSLSASANTRGSYLIVLPDDPIIMNEISSFILWKKMKGLEVNTRAFSSNSTNSEIWYYIKNAYDTWDLPPEYVLILGNAATSYIVPTWYEDFDDQSVHGDHPYSLMSSGDQFPDLQVGRITYESAGQLQSILSKIINYEFAPTRAGDDWFENLLLVGDHIDSGSSTVLTMEYVNDMMDEYPVDYSYSLVYDQPYVNSIQNALNNGVGAYFYRGFGTFSHWTETDTENLVNFNMTPLISAITCFTGNFDQPYPSDVEKFLRVGTPSTSIGAVAGFGSTSATHTCFNNIITAGIASSFYEDGNFNISAALNKGKLQLYRNYPWNPNYYVDWYTIGKEYFGDPELNLRCKTPQLMLSEHQDTISIHANFFAGELKDMNNNAISNASVTLYDSVIDSFYTGITDTNGYYQIQLNISLQTELQMTAFHPQMIPLVDTVYAVVDYTDIDLRCESAAELLSGSNNVLPFRIINDSASDLQNVSISISTDSSHVSIIDPLIVIPIIQTQSTYVYNAAVNPGNSIPSGYPLIIHTNLSHGNNTETFNHSLMVCNAEVEFSSVNLLSIPSPQADVNFSVEIENLSDISVDSLTLLLSTTDDRISITDSTAFLQQLPGISSITVSDPFTFVYDNIYNTENFEFNLLITNNQGFEEKIEFYIDNLEPTVDQPSGPDSYGYIAVHNNDAAEHLPEPYDWIEIDPEQGGSGTVLAMVDYDYEGSGDMVTVPLPFSLRFYGDLFHNLSISSNGFVMPGIHYNYDWMNRTIPGPMVPKPIIAPFWDDLLINENSRVSYYNDTANHTFIVQWTDLLNRFDNSLETFQLIIYDNNFHSQPGRENSLKFQYNEVHNTDQGSYDGFYVDHGEYATVGIADKSGQTGLEYTFANRYPATAQSLVNDTAITFRHNFDTPDHAFVILDDFSSLDADNSGEINNGEQVNLDIRLRNIGLQDCDSLRVRFESGSQYLSISTNPVSVENLQSGTTVDIDSEIHFSIDSTCPNNEKVSLSIIIEHDNRKAEYECFWIVKSPELIYDKFVYDDGDDNQIETMESGTFEVIFKKSGSLNIQNPHFSFGSNVPGMSFGNPSFSEDDTHFIVSMPFITDNTLAQGLKIEFSGAISYNNGYFCDFTFYDVCGNLEMVFSDDFTNNWQEWWMRNGTIVGTSNAGGTSPELLMSTNPDYESIVANYSFVGDIYRKLKVSFKNNLSNSPLKRAVKIVDMSPWRRNYFFINETLPTNGPREEVHFVIPALRFYDFANLYFTTGVEQQFTAHWYIDDVVLEGVRISRIRLHGVVNLENSATDYENIRLSVDGQVFNPYSDGLYEIYVDGTTVTLDVVTKGYVNQSNIYNLVSLSDISDDFNFHEINLERLPKPENLMYSLSGSHLDLDWDFSNDSDIGFTQFKIVREANNVTYIDSTSNSDFSLDLQNDRNYKLYVYAEFAENMESHNTDTLRINFVDNDDVESVKFVTRLCNNYPNPFNPSTMITFSIAEDNTDVDLSVYNIKGQKVKTLVSDELTSGLHEILWNGDNSQKKTVGSGVYFVRLKAKDIVQYKKIILIK